MATTRPDAPRKRSWIGKYKEKDSSSSGLPTPQEGQELSITRPIPSGNSSTSAISTHTPASGVGLPFKRSSSSTSLDSSTTSRPITPTNNKRWSSTTSLLTRQELDQQASQIILNALERTTSHAPSIKHAENKSDKDKASFGKMSLASMMSGFPSLSLSRSRDERGRSQTKDKGKEKRARSSSFAGREDDSDQVSARARSQSPFTLRRVRTRENSPDVQALRGSDADSDVEVNRIRPRNAFSTGTGLPDDENSVSSDEEEEDDGSDSWSDGEQFDPETEKNTETNAIVPEDRIENDPTEFADPLGEGVNVVIPPEPYFPSTLNSSQRNPRRRKSTRTQVTLPSVTSRPIFQRDRCTINVTHGDPDKVDHRRSKRYVLASDLSEESRYALEWAIGTVLRDGDELLIITVVENEDKVDPAIANPSDRMSKLRAQQERQGMAYILVRQATSLLQRTHLHVTISCQAWHAKNARHMLLDIVDYVEPTMLIVGSRGLGNLKGILLGSTSHYLIQKCSVPVMVARRRLKRPPRRSAHLATHHARLSLAEAAGIDRVATKVDEDVAAMREQVERDERDHRHGSPPPSEMVDEGDGDDTEVEGESTGTAPLGKTTTA
ncbi:hypothetical protein BDY19DRAFT_959970 [Irpex rosettiformis]|uniref:Uncharacterized protein n=1 Tax=Irpex rosettiformis TaxID=378272 RepID=A0ACB8TWM5_9APHY|nr:hypothetical protein BDY19DRAFT_959970 [Irpex rosettiformis]